MTETESDLKESARKTVAAATPISIPQADSTVICTPLMSEGLVKLSEIETLPTTMMGLAAVAHPPSHSGSSVESFTLLLQPASLELPRKAPD